ncbi:sulfur carrier protein ThiS [Corynebacterium epidermidicanis]|uniref:Thiamine biosynthesis protein ThiS n=1 Tax=Corynebacterium epidermidicanis TaxID=1050174 RepID=A0A0G3GXP7_9CORY|nr:sulfur carrier protein ThiS [Corynebacterium epidermidicanis]AKK04303.1 thiamine biosynthesis protein ThiS [Corynebacterium epidermidicanis]
MTTLNGNPHTPPAGQTIAELVQEVTGTDKGVAVAVDGAVVPRSRWKATPAAGEIEIVTAAQGG